MILLVGIVQDVPDLTHPYLHESQEFANSEQLWQLKSHKSHL